jgi:drug/metabolite transporter (DMT)-like permease
MGDPEYPSRPEHRHTDPLDMFYEPHGGPGEERRTMGTTIVLLLISVALAAVAQLTLKYGMNKVTESGAGDGALDTLIGAVKQPAVYAGFVLFAVSAIFWLVVLSRTSLSFAYPFAALTYVLILLFDSLVLGEPVSGLRWGGVALIVAGLVLISRTGSMGSA